MNASCTPCDASVTVSRSGHFVALMRRRNSVSSASGTFTRNGRTAVLSAACSLPCRVAVVGVMVCSLWRRRGDLLERMTPDADRRVGHEVSWLSEYLKPECPRIPVLGLHLEIRWEQTSC